MGRLSEFVHVGQCLDARFAAAHLQPLSRQCALVTRAAGGITKTICAATVQES